MSFEMQFRPKSRLRRTILPFTLIILVTSCGTLTAQQVSIASKHFNESYILAEIMAQLLEDRGFEVDRKHGLGGTMICYEALVNGEIDIYPEYSGTIAQTILKLSERFSFQDLQQRLRNDSKFELLDSFGFNNTYAMTVRKDLAKRLNLKNISDLKAHTDLRFGLSYEFLDRGDGWGPLSRTYSLPHTPTGMEHGLSYQALDQGGIDVMDVYSTDAEIQRYDLVLLQDDRSFFPAYLAAPFIRSDLDSEIRAILAELAGKIDAGTMQRLNAEVAIDKKSFAETAYDFLLATGLINPRKAFVSESKWQLLVRRTLTHLMLTTLALLVALSVAIPIGVLIYRKRRFSQPVIYLAGLLQTVPSIALLAFMIPLFGIGVKPAIAALILYAFLPILRNTYVALSSIDPVLKKVSLGIGLTTWQRLRHIEIPLATPTILAGVSTAAVISIGTATLAAFIGAGGLGEPIVTGLALNDPYLIMEGAIPAAILAIVVEFFFEGLQKTLIPRHLRQKN
ncbi:ABC transporter permease subunit [bacterium]|nr:ABC transporter permease subunit [bacterium]